MTYEQILEVLVPKKLENRNTKHSISQRYEPLAQSTSHISYNNSYDLKEEDTHPFYKDSYKGNFEINNFNKRLIKMYKRP